MDYGCQHPLPGSLYQLENWLNDQHRQWKLVWLCRPSGVRKPVRAVPTFSPLDIWRSISLLDKVCITSMLAYQITIHYACCKIFSLLPLLLSWALYFMNSSRSCLSGPSLCLLPLIHNIWLRNHTWRSWTNTGIHTSNANRSNRSTPPLRQTKDLPFVWPVCRRPDPQIKLKQSNAPLRDGICSQYVAAKEKGNSWPTEDTLKSPSRLLSLHRRVSLL